MNSTVCAGYPNINGGIFQTGPFSNSEMADWFSHGYFTMGLLVKRTIDEIFQPLGEELHSVRTLDTANMFVKCHMLVLQAIKTIY